MRTNIARIAVATFLLASGCASQRTPGGDIANTKDGGGDLLLVGGDRVSGNPVPASTANSWAITGRAVPLSGEIIENPAVHRVAERDAAGTVSGALAGLLAGGRRGALLDAVLGGALGASGGYYAEASAAARLVNTDTNRWMLFYTMLREGYIPANFWRSTEPPVRVRIRLFSEPEAARLVISGTPTTFSTVADLYMLPDDIRMSTLELPGYAPCRVPDSVVPGLQQPDGRDALTVRCTLAALAQAPSAGGRALLLRRGR